MSERRPAGLFRRLRGLIEGSFSGWLRAREGDNPRAVYERAIRERTRQYADLKQAIAGILYMRNRLEGEIRERSEELARVESEIERAIRSGQDDLALTLLEQKDPLGEELARARQELEEMISEAEAAKGNLMRFRSEIRELEREKVRMVAAMASAKARRRIQEAFEGLSLDADMQALENVRQQIAQLRSEANLDRELGDEGLRTRLRAMRNEARSETARRELALRKERMSVRMGGAVLEMAQ
jgi:phage shock protein A